MSLKGIRTSRELPRRHGRCRHRGVAQQHHRRHADGGRLCVHFERRRRAFAIGPSAPQPVSAGMLMAQAARLPKAVRPRGSSKPMGGSFHARDSVAFVKIMLRNRGLRFRATRGRRSAQVLLRAYQRARNSRFNYWRKPCSYNRAFSAWNVFDAHSKSQ